MKRQRHPLGPSQLGTERHLVSLHYGARQTSTNRGEKAYLQASLHADEVPGMLVMHHLIALLEHAEANHRIEGEVVLVPVANPIGLSQQLLHGGIGRFEADSGENFNRGYPDFLAAILPGIEARLGPDAATNRETIRAALRAHVDGLTPATELASLRKTLSSLACDADVVLDLHCDHDALLHLYCEAPYWPQCEPLARLLGARTVLLAKNSGGASFDEAMGGVWWQLDEALGGKGSATSSAAPQLIAHQTPNPNPNPASNPMPVPLACLAVTVELRGQMDVTHALASRDAQALFDFLVHRGLIASEAGRPMSLPAPRCEPTPLAASEDLFAPHAGVIAFVKAIGDAIDANDVVAEIIDPVAGLVTPVRARFPGKLYARALRRYASPGMAIAKVAGRTPFRVGNLLSP